MFKHLTLAFCAASLFTGCVITTGDTTDTFGTETTANTVPETEGTGTTADQPTTGGTSAATESAEGTTVEPETTAPTTGAATEPATETTAETGGTTGTPPLYGNCGWFESDVSYYACVDEGAVAGLEDPMGQFPIACPDGLAAGDPCTEDTPIPSVGCCSADGHNFFCDFDTNPDMPVLFDLDCG